MQILEDLIRGISRKLAEKFTCPVYADEVVSQGLAEPSFFISFIEAASAPLPGPRSRLQVQLDIAYFPKTPGSFAEAWDVGSELLTLLRVAELTDGSAIRGKNGRFEVVDGTLHVYTLFDLHLIETNDMPREDIMEQFSSHLHIQ